MPRIPAVSTDTVRPYGGGMTCKCLVMEALFMTRLTMVLAALLCVLSTAQGSLSPRKDQARPEKDIRAQLLAEALKSEPKNDDLVINDDTEIKWNGNECNYQDVP